MSPILKLQGVSKRLGHRQVLQDASMSLDAGVTVMLGPSGVGKSTLLRLAQGMLAPDEGTVLVDDVDPQRGGRALRQMTGYVPDTPDVPEWMTARDLFGFLAPQYPSWDKECVDGLVASLKIPLDIRFEHLSRGESMKAMLVASMAHAPRLLLLDEPFSGYDAPTREAMLSAFLVTLDVERTGVLLTTHDLDVAGRVADRVIVLNEGALHEMGTLDDLLDLMGGSTRIPEHLRDLYDSDIRTAIVEALAQ